MASEAHVTPYFVKYAPAVFLLGAAFIPQSLCAQKPHRVTRAPGELVATFARDYQAPHGPTTGAGRYVAHVLTYPEDYPAADLAVFQQGLEQLALTSDSPRLRTSSTFSLSQLGSRGRPHPVAGTMERLERIYQRSTDPAVRSMVVVSLYDVSERPEALAFLERVAKQAPGNQDFPGAASRALGSLVLMGDEGRAVLRRLHQTGAVRDADARLELDNLAKRGFRISG
jgi:hypothetical protein